MTAALQTKWDPTAARTAEALYLAIAVCGGFSIGYVPMLSFGLWLLIRGGRTSPQFTPATV